MRFCCEPGCYRTPINTRRMRLNVIRLQKALARRCTPIYSKLDNKYSKLYTSGMSRRYEVRNHVRRHRRQLHDMTQQELADRVGVTRQTILSIERGRYDPSIGLALRLAGTFGVPVETLFEIDWEQGHE